MKTKTRSGVADGLGWPPVCALDGFGWHLIASPPSSPQVKISEKEKNLKDKMAWTRDQVHLLRRLTKEVTGRVRSLRFFENVRKLQMDPTDAVGKFGGKGKAHGLLSCCGHVGEYDAMFRAAAEQMCIKPGCKAPAHPSCVISVAELGNEVSSAKGASAQAGSTSYGVKLASIVRLVKSLPSEERVLIFVQFPDLLLKVADCL